jgi:hypothetical protein
MNEADRLWTWAMRQRDNRRFYRELFGQSGISSGQEERTMDEPILQFFEHGHLPERLQEVSGPFGRLALELVKTLPRNPERTTALRKLLEAKDCAVRAVLYREPGAS